MANGQQTLNGLLNEHRKIEVLLLPFAIYQKTHSMLMYFPLYLYAFYLYSTLLTLFESTASLCLLKPECPLKG